jgi:dolichol-phosphate mannosyltransferase
MKITVVIPTYNEKENIGLLIRSLQAQFRRIPHEMHILVVDDESPDGTAETVREAMAVQQNIHLISAKKSGLGAAYIRGMEHALHSLGADAVMEMDADFSHDPEDVPRLVAELDKGADFVIGSRYVPGGRIPESWGFFRKMNSKWGNFFARYVAGLRKVRDCTAGFRAIRASVLKLIDFRSLRVQGYAFQVALLNQALRRKAIVREIPVEFVDRVRGETKLGLCDILEFMKNAWWIRFDNSKTFLRFMTVGASGVAVNLLGFTTLLRMGMNKFLASPIAIELSILSNFALNSYWTFADRNHGTKAYLRGLMFNLVSFLALGISYSTFVILSFLFPDTLPHIHQVVGIVPATLVNYFLNSYWTFKENAA